MLVTSTPHSHSAKKRKRHSHDPASLKKKRSKLEESCPVPELILCAGELKSDETDIKTEDWEIKPELISADYLEVKEEVASPKTVKRKKQRLEKSLINVSRILITDDPNEYIPVDRPKKKKKKCKLEEVEIKEENCTKTQELLPNILTDDVVIKEEEGSPKTVKRKKRKLDKSLAVNRVLIPDESPESLPADKVTKRKKQTCRTEEIKQEEIPVIKKKKKKVKMKIKEEKVDDETELSQILPEHAPIITSVDIKIKEEPITPEKPQVKIEPVLALFNSDIKQELDCADAVDLFIIKKLCYKLTDSCIHGFETQLHCAVPPAYLYSIQQGIKVQLKTLHLKYVDKLQGVLLKYTKIRFINDRTAKIVSIAPELHFDICCAVTVFRPCVGAELVGRVIKIGPGYVNCLVYGYFTAVVYDKFATPVTLDSLLRFRVKFCQVTVHNDYILKGNPL